MNKVGVILLAIAFYISLPAVMALGWVRWIKGTQARTLSSVLSFIGFTLATASALLALSSVLYALAIGGFPYYEALQMFLGVCT